MSDRPCNLVIHRQLLRKYGERVTTEVVEPMVNNWPPATRVFLDGKFIREYAHLPTEAECGAFGGTCEC